MKNLLRPIALLAVLGCLIAAPSAQQQPPAPIFRANLSLVSVDVIVRDRDGNVVKGLTEKDFEVIEDGRPQEVRTFTFAEIKEGPASAVSVDLLAGVEEKVLSNTSPSTAKPSAAVEAAAPTPMRSEDLAGRRLVILLFDTSSMQPEDVQRSVDSARKYVSTEMSSADLVAVATVSTVLNVLTDFTGDTAKVTAALNSLAYSDGTETPPPSASTAATDEAAAAATEETTADAEAAELAMFNNDLRLRALRTLAESLQPIEQKKAIIYFSAGMQRSGQDNQVELRSAVNAAVRSNVSIYSVDTRGLQAVVPGGDARQASGRGQGMFNGRGMSRQFSQLAASQDTLVSLSADTGGRAFTNTNNFGAAFTRVQRDMSAYYLLGYSSNNKNKDGRFRRIQVRLKKPDTGYRLEARSGYYADRDFEHTSKTDRETLLQEQLVAAVSVTDLPVIASAMYFRLAVDKYFVPIAVSVPGSAVPVTEGLKEITLDVLGQVMDERGMPVGRLRQTLKLPAGTEKTLAGKQILYQSGMVLPPGRFSIKAVVRENATGLMGTFEAPITVPQLSLQPMKVSSVVLSTQVQPSTTKSDNPLIRDGVQMIPNVTHVVGKDQKLFFYYEVYEPGLTPAKTPDVRTTIAFYRGQVKVLETPVVAKATIDAANRQATLFQFEVAAGSFEPGLYTCQINIIDEAAGRFTFPRVVFFVR
ncbi:MAG TPA: VWA domain-containing protein [Vicinamibacterales bacterium]|nr:VWA domain-containing protein [Vicinamibacterales bacterium]